MLIDSGAATAGKLSDLMGLTTGAVTRVIDRLEQAGYVRRVPDPTDRRRVIVELVPDRIAGGRGDAWPASATRARPEIGQYSEAELAVINDFLTRMAGDHARGGDRAPRHPRRRRRTGHPSTPRRSAASTGRGSCSSRAPTSSCSAASTDIDDLYRARFEGAVPQVRLRDGIVTIQYKGAGWPWDWRRASATDVSLNAAIPWDVELVGGAGKLQGKFAIAGPALVRADRAASISCG